MPNPSSKSNAAAAPKSKNLMLAMLVTVLISAGTAGYVWYSKKADQPLEVAPPKVATYYKLSPTFVVNMADRGGLRYLQADIQMLTHDAKTLAAIELHAPAIRNRLLLLLGEQTSAKLQDRKAKEALQKAALAEVKATLKAEEAPGLIDAVIFTSLVTQ